MRNSTSAFVTFWSELSTNICRILVSWASIAALTNSLVATFSSFFAVRWTTSVTDAEQTATNPLETNCGHVLRISAKLLDYHTPQVVTVRIVVRIR